MNGLERRDSGAATVADVQRVRTLAARFGGIELSVDFALGPVSGDLVRELRDIASQTGVVYTVHAPFRDVNIASLNEGVYRTAREDTLRALDVAVELEAPVLNVHPGMHSYFPVPERPAMKERERRLVEALCDRVEGTKTRIAIENMTRSDAHFEDAWTLDGEIALIEAIDRPQLGFCLDVGHAHQAGLDVPAAIRRLSGVRAGAGRTGSALLHLHVHDNHGAVDEHLPAGEGTIDWPSLRSALDEVEYEGVLVFENSSPDRQVQGREHLHAAAEVDARP